MLYIRWCKHKFFLQVYRDFYKTKFCKKKVLLNCETVVVLHSLHSWYLPEKIARWNHKKLSHQCLIDFFQGYIWCLSVSLEEHSLNFCFYYSSVFQFTILPSRCLQHVLDTPLSFYVLDSMSWHLIYWEPFKHKMKINY